MDQQSISVMSIKNYFQAIPKAPVDVAATEAGLSQREVSYLPLTQTSHSNQYSNLENTKLRFNDKKCVLIRMVTFTKPH